MKIQICHLHRIKEATRSTRIRPFHRTIKATTVRRFNLLFNPQAFSVGVHHGPSIVTLTPDAEELQGQLSRVLLNTKIEHPTALDLLRAQIPLLPRIDQATLKQNQWKPRAFLLLTRRLGLNFYNLLDRLCHFDHHGKAIPQATPAIEIYESQTATAKPTTPEHLIIPGGSPLEVSTKRIFWTPATDPLELFPKEEPISPSSVPHSCEYCRGTTPVYNHEPCSPVYEKTSVWGWTTSYTSSPSYRYHSSDSNGSTECDSTCNTDDGCPRHLERYNLTGPTKSPLP